MTLDGVIDRSVAAAEAPEHLRRLAFALADLGQSGLVGTPDVACLVRQALREEDERHGGTRRLRVPADAGWPTASDWRSHGLSAERTDDGWVLRALPWTPEWLNGAERADPAARALAGL